MRRRTFRKGRPRFVVFIMCDDVVGTCSWSAGMAGKGEMKKKIENGEREEGKRSGRPKLVKNIENTMAVIAVNIGYVPGARLIYTLILKSGFTFHVHFGPRA